MSKRGNFKKIMELKKLITILLFINFCTTVSSEMIEPDKNLTPYDVVKIQLNALKDNNNPSVDFGIRQTWIFAHPENKKITGPFERFRIMLYGAQYGLLLEHNSHKIKLIMNTVEKYIFGVEILSKDKKLFFYEWHLEKGSDEACQNCWFTSAVSIPIDQGNTI